MFTPQHPNLLERLQALSDVVAVSGNEGAARKLVREAIQPYVAEVRVDHLGNLFAHKAGTAPEASRYPVMVAAHLDEVGFMVTDYDSEGSLRFDAVGGIAPHMLVGKPVWVGPKRLPGVIGAAPIHLLSEERRGNYPTLNQLRIDIGAQNQSEAKKQVAIGDYGTFATEFAVVGEVLRGKALDDRLGCTTLIELLSGPAFPYDLHAVFTVQEEVGLRGAQVAAQALNPVCAFVLDCTPAQDLPHSLGRENTQYNARLGHGPAIYVADNRTISDPRLVQHLEKTAQDAGLSYQLRQPGGGGTDAGAIHLANAGIPSVSLSVPGRYLHSPAALARLTDWQHSMQLMRLALETWTPQLLNLS